MDLAYCASENRNDIGALQEILCQSESGDRSLQLYGIIRQKSVQAFLYIHTTADASHHDCV